MGEIPPRYIATTTGGAGYKQEHGNKIDNPQVNFPFVPNERFLEGGKILSGSLFNQECWNLICISQLHL